MKKNLAMILALTMLLSSMVMAGCTKEDENKDGSDTTANVSDATTAPEDTTTVPEETTTTPETDADTAEDEAAKAQAAAAPVIEQIQALNSISEVTEANYTSAEEQYTAAKTAYDALDKDAKAVVSEDVKEILDALSTKIKTYETALKVATAKAEYAEYKAQLPTTSIVNATITLDGKFDDVLKTATPMTLTKAQCDTWNAQKGKERTDDGAGVVGDTSLTEGADTNVSFYFAYDDEKFYIVERRCDLNWCFSAQDYTKAYTGDGSLLWFMNTADEAWFSSGSVKAEPACGLMWSAAIQGEEPGFNHPKIAYFPANDQSSPSEKTDAGEWDYAFSWDDAKEQFYYTLEISIPWGDLPFTKEDVEAGNISATFCSVDIVNPEFDGDSSKLWTGFGYQMQYPGVGYWKMAYPLAVVKAD